MEAILLVLKIIYNDIHLNTNVHVVSSSMSLIMFISHTLWEILSISWVAQCVSISVIFQFPNSENSNFLKILSMSSFSFIKKHALAGSHFADKLKQKSMRGLLKVAELP